MRAAISAAFGVKWMSATSGVEKPAARSCFLIAARFSASFFEGAVMRTSSQPASIMRMLCATVAAVSIVSVVVMLCTRIGWSLPMPMSPMRTARVRHRS